jgi:2-amino-4-hydroxy-6-hydroxymethyldihydropteridine diphosphokinase
MGTRGFVDPAPAMTAEAVVNAAKPSLQYGNVLSCALLRGIAMTRAYIGLGSNVGDRLQFLQRAVKDLGTTAGVHVIKVSSVYETEPVGPAAQAWFLNAVVEIDTSACPSALLRSTQGIEHALERMTTYRWGPRTIDLDILLYGNRQLKTADLKIPHPELCNRAFVMIPLLELAPEAALPDGTKISSCLGPLLPSQQVHLVAPAATLVP